MRTLLAVLALCLIGLVVGLAAYRLLSPVTPLAAAKTDLSRIPSRPYPSSFYVIRSRQVPQGVFVTYAIKRHRLPGANGAGYPGGQWVGAVVVSPGILGTWHVSGTTDEVYFGPRLSHRDEIRLADNLFHEAHGKPYQAPHFAGGAAR